jgi:hypothetical protein
MKKQDDKRQMSPREADKDKNKARGPQEFAAPERGNAGKAKPTPDKKHT